MVRIKSRRLQNRRPKLAIWLKGALLLAWLLLCPVAPVSAHAILVRSIPEANAELQQPPEVIELWFSEPLEAGFNRVRLLTPMGEELPAGPVTLDPADPMHVTATLEPLEPGIYTVAWQNLSQADGHVWTGSFSFTVLQPDGSKPPPVPARVAEVEPSALPTPAETVTRWLSLLAALLFWGAPFFQVWVVMKVLPQEAASSSRTVVLPLVALAALLLILTGWLQVALQALDLGSLSQVGGLLRTRGGGLMLARQGLALVALLVALARPPHPWTALLILGAPLLLTFSVGSHASAAPGSGWAVLGDYLHLLAAAIWLGGLSLLPILAWRFRRSGLSLSGSQWLLLLRRFSGLAVLSVFGLMTTGLFSSLVELPNLASLWASNYGRVLLIKLGLVGLALAVAGLNHRLIHTTTPLWETPAGQQRFKRQVMVELALALAVMLAVAVLVQTTPARAVVVPVETYRPSRFEEIIEADDLQVHLQVYPSQAGENSFWVHLYRDDGSPIGEVQQVRLFFDHQDETLGQSSTELRESSPAIFTTTGTYLSQGGNWDLSVYVRRRGMDDLLADTSLEIAPPPGSIIRTKPWENPIPGLSPWLLVAGGIGSLGGLVWLWRRFRNGGLPGEKHRFRAEVNPSLFSRKE